MKGASHLNAQVALASSSNAEMPLATGARAPLELALDREHHATGAGADSSTIKSRSSLDTATDKIASITIDLTQTSSAAICLDESKS